MQSITHHKCLTNKHLFCLSMGLNQILYGIKQESLGQDNAADITVL